MTERALSLISPLSAAGRAEEVVRRVGEAIKLGLFPDGAQLPTETDFAAQLGVSAMTLRDALGTLRRHGLVETRRGRTGGTFVRWPAGPAASLLRDQLRSLSDGTLRDLIDEQFAVSGAAARLAAARAPGASVRRLRALARQLASATTTGARIRADSRFHVEIALASGSERLSRLEVELQAQLAEPLWLPPGPLAMPELGAASVAAEHAAIAGAIAARDGDRARVLAEQHVERNLRRLTALRYAVGDGG
jgi:GntR family transcriptional repressor for pyruvate dehydrogenase complex